MITLYGESHWDSPWVFTAYVALREKGIPFTEKVLDLDAGEQRRDDYRHMTLTAKVPAIDHGGFVLSESSARRKEAVPSSSSRAHMRTSRPVWQLQPKRRPNRTSAPPRQSISASWVLRSWSLMLLAS